jgi:hypothetical protein
MNHWEHIAIDRERNRDLRIEVRRSSIPRILERIFLATAAEIARQGRSRVGGTRGNRGCLDLRVDCT